MERILGDFSVELCIVDRLVFVSRTFLGLDQSRL